MAIRIQIRRDTAINWTTNNPILQSGEIGYDITNKKFKVGIANDNTSRWQVLPYLNITPAELLELVQDYLNDTVVNGDGISKSYDDIAGTYTISVDTSVIANKTYVDTAISGLSNTVTTEYIPLSLMGVADGVAELDENGVVFDSQIPTNIARDSEIPSLAGYATETYVNTAVSNLVDSAPSTLNTLNELAAALGDDANYATTISTALGNKLDSTTAASTYLTQNNASSTYAPIASPTFTGTVGGITKSMVGLENIDNTSDANKPISTATQTALDLKLNITEPSVDYYVTNSGSGSYTVNGVANGLISFDKGKKYRIHVNATGHPFWIQTVSGGYSAGNVYNTGITNNGTQNGHILVELASSAPEGLYYACQFHSSMAGAISVKSAGVGVTTNSQSGSYTLSVIDSDKIIEMSGGGTLTITDSSSFPTGFTVNVLQTGSSQVNIAGNGFTVNGTPGLKLRAQWSSATLVKRGLNSWVAMGDLSV